jgi:hypothetical protein
MSTNNHNEDARQMAAGAAAAALTDENLAAEYWQATGQVLREQDKKLAFAYGRAVETSVRALLAAQPAADAPTARNAALEEAARLIETTRETTTIEGGGETQRHLTPRKAAGDLTGTTWAAGIRALKSAEPARADRQGVSEDVMRFAIDVEKALCAALGRTWSATGISIESLIAELKGRADRQGVALSDALDIWAMKPDRLSRAGWIEDFAEDIRASDRAALSRASSSRAEVEMDDTPDMFWNADDPERCQDSIHNVVIEAYENGSNVGDIVEVQQAIRLHNVKVRIIADPEDDEEISYEPLAAAEAPNAGATDADA